MDTLSARPGGNTAPLMDDWSRSHAGLAGRLQITTWCRGQGNGTCGCPLSFDPQSCAASRSKVF